MAELLFLISIFSSLGSANVFSKLALSSFVKHSWNCKCFLSSGNGVAMLLGCFVQLMEHSLLPWETLSSDLILRLADLISGNTKHEHPTTVAHVMSILESLVSNRLLFDCFALCTNFWFVISQMSQFPYPLLEMAFKHFSKEALDLVKSKVKVESLIRFLEKSDRMVQHNALSLMNCLLARQDDTQQGNTVRVSFGAFSWKSARKLSWNTVGRSSFLWYLGSGKKSIVRIFVVTEWDTSASGDRECFEYEHQDDGGNSSSFGRPPAPDT